MAGGGTRTPIIPRENTAKRRPGADNARLARQLRSAGVGQSGDEAHMAQSVPGFETVPAKRRAAPAPEPTPAPTPAPAPAPTATTPKSRGRSGAPPRSGRSRTRSKSAFPGGTPSLSRPLGQNVAVGAGVGLAGLFLGAVTYAVLLSVVEYGSAGPGMWLKAKFMNQVAAPSTSTPAPTQQPYVPGGPPTTTVPGNPNSGTTPPTVGAPTE